GGIYRRAAGGSRSAHLPAAGLRPVRRDVPGRRGRGSDRQVLELRRSIGAAERRQRGNGPASPAGIYGPDAACGRLLSGRGAPRARRRVPGGFRRAGGHSGRPRALRTPVAGGRRFLIILKSESEIAAMRKAGRVVAQAHALVRERLRPGVTTADIDSWVEEFLRRQGAVSAFKGYQGYPACTCTSVNDEVVHGIPGPRVLEEGDIVSVDIGAFVDGFCGDMAWTYPVGQVSELAQKLLRVTEEALMKGIAQAVAGNRLSDIGHAVQTHVEAAGFWVVKSFVGHGIGRSMHEAPQVPNFGRPGRGPRLKVGMTLAIEPMVNVGTDEVRILDDNWTAVTADGSLSAHFEHTVAVREGYAEILTAL